MANKDYEQLNQILVKLKEIINLYDQSKHQFGRNLLNLVSNFQRFEKDIYSSFYSAKIQFIEQIRQVNKEIRKYKENKIINNQLLEDLIKDKKNLPKPQLKEKSIIIEQLRNSIQKIEQELAFLNKKLESSNLNIDEEDDILEQISNLEKKKSTRFNKLEKIEQDITQELENSDLYMITNLIEVLKHRNEDIESKLIQLLNSRFLIHKKSLSLYRKIKSYESSKIRVEKEIDKNIILFNNYKETFKEVFDNSEHFKIIYKKFESSKETKKEKAKHVKMIVRKKKLLKKLKDERMKKALEKKKAGEKLDFYELKLILDQLEKEK